MHERENATDKVCYATEGMERENVMFVQYIQKGRHFMMQDGEHIRVNTCKIGCMLEVRQTGLSEKAYREGMQKRAQEKNMQEKSG